MPSGINESIFDQVIHGQMSPAQGLSAAMSWLGQVDNKIATAVQSDPAVQAAVATLVTDSKNALTVAADWAGTALSGELSNAAAEAQVLVQKYAGNLIGSAGNPVTAAELTALQALGQVLVAAVQHALPQAVGATSAPS